MRRAETIESYSPKEIESKWQKTWSDTGIHRTPEGGQHPSFYCLDFFPYPSGAGLSVGHCRNYVPTDVLSRYHRMKGYAVLHPMGWDAFGLPAENEALDKGIHPRDSVRVYAANCKRQMNLVGASYDWEREISSSHPAYYRWTQWMFLLLHEPGLAYQALAAVNWCNTCQTTLANEEVEGEKCWRCHQPVTRRDLRQWFFRITAYADELLAETDNLDWPEHILAMQRHWIGRSEGVEFELAVTGHPGATFRVFTTRPDTVYGMTFAVLAPEHPLVEEITALEQRAEVEAYVSLARRATEIQRLNTARICDGVPTGAHAVNPVNGRQVPIFVADYVLPSHGTGAIMAVPAHDQRDLALARRYGLPVVQVIRPIDGDWPSDQAYEGAGIVVNSGPFDDQLSNQAWQGIADAMVEQGYGWRTVQYRMRDWLISRQRYWGAPIPIIHCKQRGAIPVPKEDLPVRLPHMPDYQPRGDGRSPLANRPDFVNAPCPSCGGPGRRETDTMGGFACSSWYFLRFADPLYDAGPFNPQAIQRWLPVDLYVGGAEHAVMHLLYSRFWTKVLADAGLIHFREPFTRLRSQGVLHASDGKRMSKSRGNVVTPDEIVERYGADVLRIHLLFMVPFDRNVTWDEDGIAGSERFLQRVWRVCLSGRDPLSSAQDKQRAKVVEDGGVSSLLRATHRTILRVTRDVEAFKFNTALARMMCSPTHCRHIWSSGGPRPSFTKRPGP